MITEIRISNFKKLSAVFSLDKRAVVLVGPNNSGKTSALQAIALWEYGVRKWAAQRMDKTSKAIKRTGVIINRKDIYDIPVPNLRQLWKDLNVREIKRTNGKQSTKNILIEISVEGIYNTLRWKLPLVFDFSNSEVCYVRVPENEDYRESIEYALKETIIYLPPMSGLSSEEYKLEMGTIKTFIGQGKTADVLRNLCWYVYLHNKDNWRILAGTINSMFGILLHEPQYFSETGRIEVKYKERGNELDLINLGRGAQQILLLLSYLYADPSTIILIDEPDAHLEWLRQKEVFRFLYNEAANNQSQIIIATHSEAVLYEAIENSDVVSFTGTPHRIEKTGPTLKSLIQYGYEHYLQAEQKGWVLYLEGSTDLSFLSAFAKKLNHPVINFLGNPYVYYVSNQPSKAREHFFALRDPFPDLKGIAIFDNLGSDKLKSTENLLEFQWDRKEIENYLWLPDVLSRYIEALATDLFTINYTSIINEIINEEVPPAALKDKDHEWWKNTKMSEWIEGILLKFKSKTGLLPLYKGEYYLLVEKMNPEEIHEDILTVLSKIQDIASLTGSS